MRTTNRRLLLKTRPQGMVADTDFETVEEPVPELGDGEALVRVEYLSIDPTLRGWMERDTYMPAIPLGDVVRCGAIGEVVASHSDIYKAGDRVFGLLGWQDFAVVGTTALAMPVPADVDPLDAVGVLGTTGVTAYFGMLDVGEPVEGETVVVSGAAGATGSVAGQIAKIKGCRVVGIAGGPEKCAWLTDELGFDAAIDYKNENVESRLAETCPGGVDVFFDNVGGEILDAVLGRINQGARIALCGAISQYNDFDNVRGPGNYINLIGQRGKMQGFLLLDYLARMPEATADLQRWIGEGRLKHRVDLVEGLTQAPEAVRRLFTGKNFGKVVVAVDD